ncbi:hypothetical protein GCM10011576_37830 [Micromonospora parathelypteridis]|nr:hypothetical protein GCM10011576_37830 [Micromonospora parathelypteridis]
MQPPRPSANPTLKQQVPIAANALDGPAWRAGRPVGVCVQKHVLMAVACVDADLVTLGRDDIA